MSTYGVTPQSVADRIQGFLLDSNSRPTIDTVEMIIEEQAAKIDGYLYAKGIEVPMSSSGVAVVRSVLMDLVISYVERARSRGTSTLVDDAWARGTEALDQIYNRPASVGEAVGARLSNMSVGAGGSMRGSRDGGCCERRPTLLERMAREGKL